MPSSISSGPATKPPDQPVAAHPASTSSTDLASSLPAPIVRLLLLLARPIAFLRISIEVLSWKAGRRVESWMVVGAWWGICLGARHAFKYLLPIAVFLPLLPLDRLRLPHVSQNTKKPPPPESTPSQPSTQDTLLHTLSDLHAIYALLPPSPSTQVQDLYVRFANLGNTRLVRGLVIIWSTWVVLGYIVGVRALLAMIGSIILLLPSPAFAHLHHHLSKSLFVRRGLALVFLLTFGSPPEQSIQFDLSFSVTDWVKGKWAASRRPSLALSFRPKVEPPASGKQGEAAEEEKDDVQAGEPIYFRFELHENQRWWMGLDWTSALLPQERPSWCDSHLLPASPPPSFPLPASSSITLPSPTPSDPESKVIRTATWKWLDDDWSIVRAGPGQNASPSISAPATIPTQSSTTEGYNVTASPARPSSASFGHSPDDSSLGPTARAQSIAEQAFTKGLERLKARTTATPATSSVKAGSPRSSIEISRGRSESQASEDMVAVLEHAEGKAGVASVGPIGGGETIVERDDATDMDGWVYGDNKWENMGPKGGLGRFTRRRRWQRRAICSETIQRIHSTPIQTQSSIPEKTDPSISESTEKPSPTLVTPLKAKPTPSTAESALSAIARRERSLSPTKERRPSSSLSNDRIEDAGMLIGATSPGAARDDVLRQRLKKAMGSVGG